MANVLEAVRRAEALGWKQIGLGRLARLASGDLREMPPDPNVLPLTTEGP